MDSLDLSSRPISPTLPVPIEQMVASLGSKQFDQHVARTLNRICGADHFAVFRFARKSLQRLVLGGVHPGIAADDLVARYVGQRWWERDPAMCRVRDWDGGTTPQVVHVDLTSREYADVRREIYSTVRDRLIVFEGSDSSVFSMSIIRSQPSPRFTDLETQRLADHAGLLMSLLIKHTEIQERRVNAAQAVTVLAEIEHCLSERTDLPQRQIEVCARILNGLTSTGIALDIGVGEESVRTYRKRAYERLGVGSERELLVWYLKEWSDWRGLLAPMLPN